LQKWQISHGLYFPSNEDDLSAFYIAVYYTTKNKGKGDYNIGPQATTTNRVPAFFFFSLLHLHPAAKKIKAYKT